MGKTGSKIGVLSVALIVFAGCDKPPEAPVRPASRGTLAGYITVGDGLKASRLVAAGCVQVIQKAPAVRVAEFSAAECPSDSDALVDPRLVVFSLEFVPGDTPDTFLLKSSNTTVGEVLAVAPRDELSYWEFRHLCQVSDPGLPLARQFAEFCRVEFETESSETLGRYRELRVSTLEEVVARKLAEEDRLSDQSLDLKKKAQGADRSLETFRRDLDMAKTERENVYRDLVEAQRALRNSMVSNETVHRGLDRAKAQAELEFAILHIRYLETYTRFAKSEQRRAGLIKERLDASERAKNRETEIIKLLESVPDQPSLKAVLDQNRQLIMTDEARRGLEEEMAFALAEAQKLDKLEKEDLKAAHNLIIEKKDALAKLDRLPPPSNNSKKSIEE